MHPAYNALVAKLAKYDEAETLEAARHEAETKRLDEEWTVLMEAIEGKMKKLGETIDKAKLEADAKWNLEHAARMKLEEVLQTEKKQKADGSGSTSAAPASSSDEGGAKNE